MPTKSDTAMNNDNETCSPNSYPREVRILAQIHDAIKNSTAVNVVFVSAKPATTGTKAFMDGVNFPKKIHHMPRLANVS